MNKITSIIIILGLIITFSIVFMGNGSKKDSINITGSAQNTEIKNGVQYITVNAGGGYSPKVSFAKAGIPTKLIMKTNGIYDCSASLVIRSINFQKILPRTGEIEINLGIPKVEEQLQGVCGMGMYNFTINFN